MPTPPNPQHFRLIALPSLFIEHGRIDRYLPPGSPVSDYMRRLGWDPKTMHARVSIDGRFVDQAQWEYATPQAGQSVVMRSIPGAGGGGGGGDAAGGAELYRRLFQYRRRGVALCRGAADRNGRDNATELGEARNTPVLPSGAFRSDPQ